MREIQGKILKAFLYHTRINPLFLRSASRGSRR